MVVLETLIRQLEISKDELIKFRKDNLITKGGYKHGHFLHWSADVDYRSMKAFKVFLSNFFKTGEYELTSYFSQSLYGIYSSI